MGIQALHIGLGALISWNSTFRQEVIGHDFCVVSTTGEQREMKRLLSEGHCATSRCFF
jgi:hypothetical protein